MISCPTVQKHVIQKHYDISTLFYRLLWGPHIHHGLWHGNERVGQAQVQLTDTLAELAAVGPGTRVLDVGCGMGGSSIRLAKRYQCSVVGITLSPLQRRWAATSSFWHGVRGDARFLCSDAEEYDTAPQSLDVVWSIECTEHLFDKAAFFQRAVSWLRPGGRVAICAWLAGETDGNVHDEQQVYDVCEGFFCPSLGSMSDYVSWFEQAGLKVTVTRDWTANVMRTWEICRRRVARTGVGLIGPWLDGNATLFLNRFDTILNAYRSGAMQYGCIVAEKPANPLN